MFKPVKSLKYLIRKSDAVATIVHYFTQIYFATNINHLLVQLVGPLAIKLAHLCFVHIILLFHVEYMIPTV